MTEHHPNCGGFDDDAMEAQGICVDMCFSHMACEPANGEEYLVCGECLHVFQTEAELILADLEVRLEIRQTLIDEFPEDFAAESEPEAMPLDQIFSCPYCVHDF